MTFGKNRKPNTIDLLRFFAAFTVVWYHSNFVIGNISLVNLQSFLNSSFLAWSLIFFFAFSARFSLQSVLEKGNGYAYARIKKITILIMAYGFLYESLRYLRAFNLDLNYAFSLNPSQGFMGYFKWFTSANESANYFLWYLLIYLVAAVFLVKTLNRSHVSVKMTLITGVVVSLGYLYLFQFDYFNQITVTLNFSHMFGQVGMLVGFLYSLFFIKHKIEHQNATIYSNLSIFLAIISISIAGFLLSENVFVIFVMVFAYFLLFISEKYYFLTGTLLSSFSNWGRDYSLAIFLLHPFSSSALDHIVPLLPVGNNFLTYVMINISSFIAALLLAVYLSKVRFCRYFLTI